MNQILGRVSLYYNNIFIGSKFECNIERETETLFRHIDGVKTPVHEIVTDQTLSLHSILEEENTLLKVIIKLKEIDVNFCRLEESNQSIVLHFKGILLCERNPLSSFYKFNYQTMEIAE